MTFDEHIQICGRTTGLRPGAVNQHTRAFRDALAADPTLRAVAEERLAGLVPAILDRDHVSKWLKALLERALDAAH